MFIYVLTKNITLTMVASVVSTSVFILRQLFRIVKVIDAESPLTCIDIMPDGATAAVGSTRGKVYIYDLRQGGNTPIHIFQAHKTSVRSVKFMPTSKLKVRCLYSRGTALFKTTLLDFRVKRSKTHKRINMEHCLMRQNKTACTFSRESSSSSNDHDKNK